MCWPYILRTFLHLRTYPTSVQFSESGLTSIKIGVNKIGGFELLHLDFPKTSGQVEVGFRKFTMQCFV